MVCLERFNQLGTDEAGALLAPCVALPDWVARLVAGRPYPDRDTLLHCAAQAASLWRAADLTQAMLAHPRIGEAPRGETAEAALSRQEQSALSPADAALRQALRDGNRRYEASFGRVFLIRARGRSGAEILQALQRRLQLSEAEEIQEALEQLRQITLLRLEGIIQP
ncbi:2-oxo-4-hydroxy-4-carboxy-5-ureidoimidazoline decarboxylase [Affinibrenneria salicis]|uniref:2-oxo-4-hydroxy-4-carboxy-5-ureidoimidazoline decarboxylase n=1 Tax=Affinibrenneria salicis TaxID=2590031 RepID=A0A5J5G3D0_9GAMM|nr:2-oxo-4-hydroxy-4-carboxy-5-ureidoimidazoline decarboxylase [Affinibrenneria salicis]KAA9001338.1 2-oxo-4-hydroxy-4-carboxy-5-ureidoimidazoline decarboxylase [Affinibrenneria salicis]